VNAKSTLGRITSTVRIGTLPSRGTVLTAWKLGAGATPAKPWGPRTNISEVYLGQGH